MNNQVQTILKSGFQVNQIRVDEKLIQISSPLISTERSIIGGNGATKKDLRLLDKIKLSDAAYITDGLVRQIVDAHTENFKDFTFRSENEKAQEYLEKRLNIISLRMGEYWKSFLARTINELFKVGTGCVIKIRGDGGMSDSSSLIEPKRAMYSDKPYAISSFQLVSAAKLSIGQSADGKVLGLKLAENHSATPQKLKTQTILRNSKPLPKELCKVQRQSVPASQDHLFIPNIDIALITHNRPADAMLGIGIVFSGLEDLTILRSIESTVSIMIKKYSMPLLHHVVRRTTGPAGSFQNEIDRAQMMHMRASPDGAFVTGDNHELKILGGESHALRVEGHLDFFSSRAAVGLGGSAELLGLRGTGSAAAYEAAADRLKRRIKFCQEEIAWQLNFDLFWELLYEGGFDPYEKTEDRVFIEFVSIDDDDLIKKQTHAADLHTKGLIDHDQALTIAKGDFHGAFKKKPQESKMFVNRSQIPLKKAGSTNSNNKKLDTKKPKTKKEFITELRGYWPEKKEEIPDFLFVISRLYSLELEKVEAFQEPISDLLHDPQAVEDFLYQNLNLVIN